MPPGEGRAAAPGTRGSLFENQGLKLFFLAKHTVLMAHAICDSRTAPKSRIGTKLLFKVKTWASSGAAREFYQVNQKNGQKFGGMNRCGEL